MSGVHPHVAHDIKLLTDFEDVKNGLLECEVIIDSSEVTQIASTEMTVNLATAKKVANLMAALDDHEDVQKIYNNMALTDEIIAELM